MTTQEMHNWFDLVLDKFDQIYFSDDEKDEFLNRAQEEYVNGLLFKRGDTQDGIVIESLAELSQDWELFLHPLVKKIQLATGSNGTISLVNVEASLGGELLKIMSINKDSNGYPVQFVRVNDKDRFHRNYYKKAAADNLQFSIYGSNINILPTGVDTYNIIGVRKAVDVELGITDSELPSVTHNKIVAKALSYTTIPTEAEALGALNEMMN